LEGALKVVPVERRAELDEFVGLPYRLHAGDPAWVPPLRRDVRLLLSRARNPFFEQAEAAYAWMDTGNHFGKVVIRL